MLGFVRGHCGPSSLSLFSVSGETIMRIPMKFAAVAAVLVVAACGSPKDANKSNFSKAIQAYLDTQSALCVDVPFGREGHKLPAVIQEQKGSSKDRAEALVEAGLLGKRETQVESRWSTRGEMLPATEYQATELGKRYLVTEKSGSAKFCTGKYKVTGIDNFTEPAQNQWVSATVSQATFQYEITDLAEWAQSEKLRAVYEREFKDLEKTQDKAALILTNEGWIHERLFKL
jgi:DNA-binding PadR family transcriptional regulator